MVAFYYGNLTRPSQDPPRVGLLSTVPSDAGSALQEAVASAVKNGGIFPCTLSLPLSPSMADSNVFCLFFGVHSDV